MLYHGKELANTEMQEIETLKCFVLYDTLLSFYFLWSQVMGESNISFSELAHLISLLLASIQRSQIVCL